MITRASFIYRDREYGFDPSAPIDISLPLLPGPENVNCYYAEPVRYEVISVGDFVGSTLQGGSCNYLRTVLTPHGNGTHTECYGHISADGAVIGDCLRRFLFFATLITVSPEKDARGDQVIGLKQVAEKLEGKFPEAVLIRSLPNGAFKKNRQYSGTNPPYLHHEVCHLLAQRGVQHLLIDLPSVDKEWDEGLLLAHRAFWNYPDRRDPEPHRTDQVRRDCSITELIYVPDRVADGDYLLNLQIINLAMDASPGKPLLYQLV